MRAAARPVLTAPLAGGEPPASRQDACQVHVGGGHALARIQRDVHLQRTPKQGFGTVEIAAIAKQHTEATCAIGGRFRLPGLLQNSDCQLVEPLGLRTLPAHVEQIATDIVMSALNFRGFAADRPPAPRHVVDGRFGGPHQGGTCAWTGRIKP
jgi:hypothetical protein